MRSAGVAFDGRVSLRHGRLGSERFRGELCFHISIYEFQLHSVRLSAHFSHDACGVAHGQHADGNSQAAGAHPYGSGERAYAREPPAGDIARSAHASHGDLRLGGHASRKRKPPGLAEKTASRQHQRRRRMAHPHGGEPSVCHAHRFGIGAYRKAGRGGRGSHFLRHFQV